MLLLLLNFFFIFLGIFCFQCRNEATFSCFPISVSELMFFVKDMNQFRYNIHFSFGRDLNFRLRSVICSIIFFSPF